MKLCSPPFVGWRLYASALIVVVGCMLAPAYCQNPNVALLLQQTPNKGGAITPTAGVYHFEQNTQVSLTALPKPGYQFVYWLGDVSEPAATSTMVYLDKPKIIVAIFEKAEFGTLGAEESLTAPGGGGGGGGGAGSSLMTNAVSYGQNGGISGGSGGKKTQVVKPGYPNIINEPIPEPATIVLLMLGSVFVFTRPNKKGIIHSNS
ncbi:MAG: PEP-CTERM sorting domain-containing protein [Phycisphaerales bacterium]